MPTQSGNLSPEIYKRLLILAVNLFFLFLFGCESSNGSPTAIASYSTITVEPTRLVSFTVTPTLTSTPQPTKPPTPTPTKLTTSTPPLRLFPTPLAGSLVTERCPRLVSQFPEGHAPSGILLLNQLNDRNFQTGVIESLNIASGKITSLQVVVDGKLTNPLIWDISPDRTKFAYFVLTDDGKNSQLHIRSANGNELSVPYWDKTWPGNAFWLDNSRLQIRFRNGDSIVLNTISGSWEKFVLPAGFQDPISLFYPGVTYDNSTSRFLYLAGNEDQVLYNIQSGQELWRKGWAADGGMQAEWSADHKQFIVNINTGGLSLVLPRYI